VLPSLLVTVYPETVYVVEVLDVLVMVIEQLQFAPAREQVATVPVAESVMLVPAAVHIAAFKVVTVTPPSALAQAGVMTTCALMTLVVASVSVPLAKVTVPVTDTFAD
jgi:hypothetical protein